MRTPKTGKALKIVYLTVGVICLMLGVIGLVIPIIPGILFLAAALYLLSRVSRRVRRFARRDRRLRELQQRIDRLGDISPVDRLRVGGWMLIDSVVKGIAAVGGIVRRVVPRNTRRYRALPAPR